MHLGESLMLTEPLPHGHVPMALDLLGGVAEYMFGHESQAIRRHRQAARGRRSPATQPAARRCRSVDPGQRIRATVIGASQFTVQVSGKTIYLSDPYVLPVHNVPVVHVGLDLPADFDRRRRCADGIRSGLAAMDLASRCAHGDRLLLARRPGIFAAAAAGRRPSSCVRRRTAQRDELLFLMIDGDIGKTFGQLLAPRARIARRNLICDRRRHLQDLDYVDVGEMISPPGVVPVVIKSLLFA